MFFNKYTFDFEYNAGLSTKNLVERIKFGNPGRILDLSPHGGISMELLHQKWPSSKIVKYRKPFLKENNERFISNNHSMMYCHDMELKDNTKYDLIFSSELLHLFPNHQFLLKQFSSTLNASGILAIQMPMLSEMNIWNTIAQSIQQAPWCISARVIERKKTSQAISDYYDSLYKYFQKFEIWSSEEIFALELHYYILQVLKSIGLNNYLSLIKNADDRCDFEAFMLEKLMQAFPMQINGKVLLPVKRLFILAQK